MRKLINERIKELEEYVNNLRVVIVTMNKKVLENGYIPNEQQKAQIEHYAKQGKKALQDIEILNDQLEKL
ncbi:hypothetical protein [Winogradskyella tangerina]|uniref:hypothetical protein n=1 Tax=Winogradskyella tangerina TaxID=2023240 RepID=UPI000DBE05DB|nr:hypothetical protein [Winogradskyella tangerina]